MARKRYKLKRLSRSYGRSMFWSRAIPSSVGEISEAYIIIKTIPSFRIPR